MPSSDSSPPAMVWSTGIQQDKKADPKSQRRTKLAAFILLVAVLAVLSISFPLIFKRSYHRFVPEDACRSTRYPDMCFTLVSRQEKYGPRDMLQSTTRAATLAAQKMLKETVRVSNTSGFSVKLRAVLDDCADMLASAVDQLHASLEEISKDDEYQSKVEVSDAQTWMSAALTYEDTCTDEIEEAEGRNEELESLKKAAQKAKKLLSNALALMEPLVAAWQQSLHPRRLLSQRRGYLYGHHHLTGHHIPPNVHVVVAADGSGQFRTIQDAVNAAPMFNYRRYIVHIRAGVYKENINVKAYHRNVVFAGDGRKRTIITGNKSATQPGITTITSATVAVEGKGFMAHDLTVENTAGPRAGQAVALRVAADRAAFFRCSFHGYQDTLLVHTFRQFFHDCTVTGTVDYVSGNAAAVFQKCNFRSGVPLQGQQTVVTAQARSDPAQTTGLSFHMCTVGGNSTVYLGRPWKEYARVVWLRTNMAAAVDPAGWLTVGETAFGVRTSYFAEYRSWGPGGNVRGRVPWSKVITKALVAKRFMPVNFIRVSQWLPRGSVLIDEKL